MSCGGLGSRQETKNHKILCAYLSMREMAYSVHVLSAARSTLSSLMDRRKTARALAPLWFAIVHSTGN